MGLSIESWGSNLMHTMITLYFEKDNGMKEAGGWGRKQGQSFAHRCAITCRVGPDISLKLL